MIAIVDTGVLYSAIDKDDRDYSRCAEVLRRTDLDLIVPALVVAEVCYLISRRMGPTVEADFLRGLSDWEVEAPSPEDWPDIARLVERYGDFPLGGTDASIAVLAERQGTDLIITLDRRHFGAIQMKNGRHFRLLPDPA